MQVVDWRKALILWFQDKVEILEYHSVFARSASAQFQVPSVLRLKSYIRHNRKARVRFCRENVYIRDGFVCQYCTRRFERKELTLDHVFPASKGGLKSWMNVVTACRSCNQRKANRTPEQARMPLLNRPEQPQWLPEREFRIAQESAHENWGNYITTLQLRAFQGTG